MSFTYKCLKKQKYDYNQLALVPIRFEDRYLIMQWRNEQIYHLRQESKICKRVRKNISIKKIAPFLVKKNQINYYFLF